MRASHRRCRSLCFFLVRRVEICRRREMWQMTDHQAIMNDYANVRLFLELAGREKLVADGHENQLLLHFSSSIFRLQIVNSKPLTD